LACARRQIVDEAVVLAFPDERADLEAEAERREGLATLERILDTLPIEQRAVFTLFELDGLSSTEIAELCEIPLGTVYTRLRLAREAFQRQIGRVRARTDFQEGALLGSPARARAAGAQR